MDFWTLLRSHRHRCTCPEICGNPPHPYCVICGALVGFVEVRGRRSNTTYVFENDTIDTRHPLEWSTRCRIIFQAEPDTHYQLSGVGRYTCLFKNQLKVHFNRDSCSVNLSENTGLDRAAKAVKIRNFLDYYNEDEYPGGYIVHNNCWILLEWVLGRQAETDLELFLQILRERFDENPFNIDQYADGGDGTTPSRRWRCPPLMKTFKGHLIQHYYGPNAKRNRRLDNLATRDIVSLRDPLRIAGLPKAIRKSVRNKSRVEVKRKTRRWSRIESAEPTEESMKAKSGSYKLLNRLFCPDIVYLILDHLSEPRDINNSITAFGWRVPDRYWKGRVPRNILLELGNTRDDLHWKSLFMGYSALLHLPELQNRHRVVALVEEVKRRFLGAPHRTMP